MARMLTLGLSLLAVLALPCPAVGEVSAGSHALTPPSATGTALVNLRAPVRVPSVPAGPPLALAALQDGTTRPLSLVAADLDGDGTPDLIAGYATATGGVVVVHRGNLEALWPASAEAQARAAAGGLVAEPFLAGARAFTLPGPPDLLAAGDFDGDDHVDVLAATAGGTALTLLPGDGGGGLGAPLEVPLPGPATALVVGDLNRRDGLPDIAVAVRGDGGTAALVFEGPGGAIHAVPETVPMPAEVTSLAIGQLVGGHEADLVAATRERLLLVHGRDRRSALDAATRAAVPPAQVETIELDWGASAVAVGDFVAGEELNIELAVLDERGLVRILDPAGGRQLASLAVGAPSPDARPRLVRAKVSALPTDDLLLVDRAASAVRILVASEREATGLVARPWAVSVATGPAPAAVLPMRLNVDGLDDLVILTGDGLAVSATAAAATFVVNYEYEVRKQCDIGDGVCIGTYLETPPQGGPQVCKRRDDNRCSYNIALAEANATAAMDTISVQVAKVYKQGGTFTAPITLLGNNATLVGVGIYLDPGAAASVVRGVRTTNDDPTVLIPVSGISMACSGSYVEGNTFGPPSNKAGWFQHAVFVNGARNTIGGSTAVAGNTILATAPDDTGLTMSFKANENTVLGNVIGGTASAGTHAKVGVEVSGETNTIGGTAPGARNVIGGSFADGVSITGTGHLVQGNRIGVDASGATARGCRDNGVSISGTASSNTVGGTTPAAANVISGNGAAGVLVEGWQSKGNQILGNLIGTDAGGTRAIPNVSDGITLIGQQATVVGGAVVGAGNVISGNTGNGVTVALSGPSGTIVQGNLIGVGKNRQTPLGNGLSGVAIEPQGGSSGISVPGGAAAAALRTHIGGDAGAGNVIAHNTRNGVTVSAGTGTAILGNSVFSNGRLGIDLGDDGWTPNGATGGANPNKWQRFPVITGIETTASTTTVTGTLSGLPGQYTVELHSNWDCGPNGLLQGHTPYPAQRQAVTVASGGVGTFTATLPGVATAITATATDADGNTSEFSPPNLRVTTVEVTQAIQNLAGQVPLVESKPTMVRAYVQALGCPVPEVSAELRGPLGTLKPQAGAPAETSGPNLTRPSHAERSHLTRTLNFLLPVEWAKGTPKWTVEVNPRCDGVDAACGADNRREVSGLTFRAAPPVHVVFVPVRHVPTGLLPAKAQYINDAWVNAFQAYPTAEVHVLRQDPPLEFHGALDTPSGWDDLLSAIKSRQGLSARKPGANTRFYGVVHENVPYILHGIGLVPGSLPGWLDPYWYAAGRTDPSSGKWVLLHELAHTFGRLHTGCTDGEKLFPKHIDSTWPQASYSRCDLGLAHADGHFGVDPLDMTVKVPSAVADFMSYAFLPRANPHRPVWVSEHTFKELGKALSAGAAGAGAAAAVSGEHLMVRGSVGPGERGTLDTVLAVTDPGFSPSQGGGEYTLALQNAAGQTLASTAFELHNPHLDPATDAWHYVELVARVAGAARLVLTHGTTTLATRAASASPPTVTVTYPNGGETLSGSVTATWSAADADGNSLTYAVQYSRDGGATWQALATDLASPSLPIDANRLPGGDACLLRVLASDGFHTAQDASDATFRVGRKDPEPLITSPPAGARLPAGAPLRLAGLGFDPEDGELPGSALAWRGDVAGALGTGAEVLLPTGLALGSHTVTLTATDSAGRTATASVTVTVVPAEAPALPAPQWLQVASRASGLAGSQWRTALGLLASAAGPANVELRFHGSAGVAAGATHVPAGAQVAFPDIVGELGASGSGAFEVLADAPLLVTSRTYNLVPGSATCVPGGTFGQFYPSQATGSALAAGDVAWLPHLVESSRFRSNLAFTNTGPSDARLSVDLLDGAGAALTTFAVTVPPGQWLQETRAFKNRGGRSDIDAGSARVTVVEGKGVIASASVIDNTTNDPTTVPARPEPAAGAALTQWVQVASRASGLYGSEWRTDLGLLNPGATAASALIRFHPAAGGPASSATRPVARGEQLIVADVVGVLGGTGNGALEITTDVPLLVTSRTYNLVAAGAACFPRGTFGQYYPAHSEAETLASGGSATLPQLVENASFRTNLTLTNTGGTAAQLAVDLLDGEGTVLTSFSLNLAPRQVRGETQVFRNRAGQTALATGSARVRVTTGSGVIASASVIDNTTNDPTTIPMER